MPPHYDYPDEGWNPYSQHIPRRSRSTSSHPPVKIVIEPDEAKQAIYNQTREEQKRLNVASQTNDDLLSPPTVAPPMTRSFTGESYASSNCSGSEDLHASTTQESVVTENGHQGPRPRGRRHRPLDAETRLHTALKRKLKLTCGKHRQKKTTCDCYDFSKLEEGYRRGHTAERRTHHRPSQNRLTPHLAPAREPNNSEQFPEHNVFGTGGGILSALSPSPSIHTDDYDIPDPLQSPSAVPRNIQRLVNGFDINQFDDSGVYLNTQLVPDSAGYPYHPGTSPVSSSPLSQQHEQQSYYHQRPHQQSITHHHQFQHIPETTTRQPQQHQQPQQQQQQQPSYSPSSFIPIGSQVLGYASLQRWQCAHKYSQSTTAAATTTTTADTAYAAHHSSSSSSSNDDCCTWTGPFSELRAHFAACHHAFEEAYPEPRMSLCLVCNAIWPGWDLPSGCVDPACSVYGSSLQKWYYGSAASSDGSGGAAAEDMGADLDGDAESLFSGYSEGAFSWGGGDTGAGAGGGSYNGWGAANGGGGGGGGSYNGWSTTSGGGSGSGVWGSLSSGGGGGGGGGSGGSGGRGGGRGGYQMIMQDRSQQQEEPKLQQLQQHCRRRRCCDRSRLDTIRTNSDDRGSATAANCMATAAAATKSSRCDDDDDDDDDDAAEICCRPDRPATPQRRSCGKGGGANAESDPGSSSYHLSPPSDHRRNSPSTTNPEAAQPSPQQHHPAVPKMCRTKLDGDARCCSSYSSYSEKTDRYCPSHLRSPLLTFLHLMTLETCRLRLRLRLHLHLFLLASLSYHVASAVVPLALRKLKLLCSSTHHAASVGIATGGRGGIPWVSVAMLALACLGTWVFKRTGMGTGTAGTAANSSGIEVGVGAVWTAVAPDHARLDL